MGRRPLSGPNRGTWLDSPCRANDSGDGGGTAASGRQGWRTCRERRSASRRRTAAETALLQLAARLDQHL